MPLTVLENRTVLDSADAVTNFNQGTLNTTDFAESTGSVSLAINIGTDQLFYNGAMPSPTFVNLAKELIYVWSSNNATQNSFSAAGSSSHALWLSDGTNAIIVTMSGNDRVQFRHADTQVQFECFLIDLAYLDTANTDGRITAITGTYASFDSAAITEIGAYYVTLSKALAGGFNTFIDVIRYGGIDDGISIYGNSSPLPKYAELAAADRSKSAGAAHGIFREYTAGIYGCQGTIRHGLRAAVSPGSDSYFFDSGVVVAFEDRLVGDDKFKFAIDGRSDFVTDYELVGSTITSARPQVEVDCSSANIDRMVFDGVSFIGLGAAATFPTDTKTQSPEATHQVKNGTFDGQGQINPGTIDFQSLTVTNSTVAAGVGSVLLDINGSSAGWSLVSFVQGVGVGHAIEITEPGTYAFSGITFSGYGVAAANDAAVYNNSGGLVTINVTSGDTPTVRNNVTTSPEATTVVNNNVSTTITNIQPLTEVRVYLAEDFNSPIDTTQIAGIEDTGSPSEFQFSAAAGTVVDIVVFNVEWILPPNNRIKNYTVPTTDTSFPISQIIDRNFSNP